MTEDLYEQAKADFLRAKAADEEVDAAIRQAQAKKPETQAEVARMQNVLDWFEQRRPQRRDEPQERTAEPVPAPPEPASTEPAPAKKNLNDLVSDAVEKLGGSAKNSEILEYLRREGHDYDALQVRGAAKHCGRKGTLVSGGYGIWNLPPATPPSHHFPPAASDAPAMNGSVPAGTY